MKYRVKVRCYWYNTGMADNHYYINYEDFDTIEEAQAFKNRITEQFEMGQKWERNEIPYAEFKAWEDNFDRYEVENGFIDDYPEIVKYFPAQEEDILV